MKPIGIVGSYLSPFVRKVLCCLHLKGIPYEIDPIVPFYANDDFENVSPLRRVPVMFHEEVVLADSTAIVEYLHDRFIDEAPYNAPLFPSTPKQRAKARWVEELADTRIADVLIWSIWKECSIKPFVFKQTKDLGVVDAAWKKDVPLIIDYLERRYWPMSQLRSYLEMSLWLPISLSLHHSGTLKC